MTDKLKNGLYGVTGVAGVEVVEQIEIPTEVDSVGIVKVVIQLVVAAFSLFKMLRKKG